MTLFLFCDSQKPVVFSTILDITKTAAEVSERRVKDHVIKTPGDELETVALT